MVFCERFAAPPPATRKLSCNIPSAQSNFSSKPFPILSTIKAFMKLKLESFYKIQTFQQSPETQFCTEPKVCKCWLLKLLWPPYFPLLFKILAKFWVHDQTGSKDIRYILSMGVLSQIFCQMGGKCIFPTLNYEYILLQH